MKQFAGVQRLGHRVREIQTRHRFVGHFGVNSHHFGAVKGGDESQHRTHGWQKQVSARLVGLGLERKAHAVALVDAVIAEEIERLAKPRVASGQVLGGVDFGALAATPENIGFSAQLSTQIDRPHRFLEGEAAHLRIVGGKSTFLEYRVREKVGGRHGDLETVIVERLLE